MSKFYLATGCPNFIWPQDNSVTPRSSYDDNILTYGWQTHASHCDYLEIEQQQLDSHHLLTKYDVILLIKYFLYNIAFTLQLFNMICTINTVQWLLPSVMRCWHGYLPGARCKWHAYGSADATATPSSLLQQNPEWFILLVPDHLCRPGQRDVKRL